MKSVLALVVHLFATVAKCLGYGGAWAVAAGNFLLKHRLLIRSRSRQRAPNLFAGDRFLLGLCSFFPQTSRIEKVAAGLRASALLNFHRACIKDQVAIEKILSHLNENAPYSQATLLPDSWAPPQARLFARG